MFYTLLNEVSAPSSDLLATLCIANAWTSFMERFFDAYTHGRESELSLQLTKGQVNDLTEHELKQKTAWLWARDKIIDLIKSSSNGNACAQFNCVLALSGLISVVARYA